MSLVELVAVITLVGILAVAAVAFFDKRAMDTASFGDRLYTAVAFAQKISVGQRHYVQVTFSSGSLAVVVCSVSTCASTVTTDLPAMPNPLTPPSGSAVTLSLESPPATPLGLPYTLTFDPLGRPGTITAGVWTGRHRPTWSKPRDRV